MIAALALAGALAAAPAGAATVKLFAFDESGRALDLPGLLARLGRADDKLPRDPAKAPLWAVPVGSSEPVRVSLAQLGPLVTATWPGGAASLRLVWPIRGDGYGAVVADNGGHGFEDGAAVFLDEEIALTEYRLLKESRQKLIDEGTPPYAPSKHDRSLAEAAKSAIAAAQLKSEAPARAAAFEEALHASATAEERTLIERGRQLSRVSAFEKSARFGLTLDDGVLKRLDDLDWIAASISHAHANWVRLVFRPNPADFFYANDRSFNEYDAIVKALRARDLKVMGCALDTAQWPRTMTPEAYATRVKNLASRYKGRVDAWEVGSELNGDWLGGMKAPLTSDQVFRIFTSGAAAAREADPKAEVVATLYAWEETAPDRAHSLTGWLATYVPQGFGRGVDVVGLELFPEDNPVGPAFERLFADAAAALPDAKLMLSSFGYVEQTALRGYWWLSPEDVDGARKDLASLYTAAACAVPHSLCGGFWWQTLDQMLPPDRQKATDLFKVYAHALRELGR